MAELENHQGDQENEAGWNPFGLETWNNRLGKVRDCITLFIRLEEG